MKPIHMTVVILLALAACSGESNSSSSELRATGQNSDAESSTQSSTTALDLTLGGLRLMMPIFSCTGTGGLFELAAAVDPDDAKSSHVGIVAFEMADAADRSLLQNVSVTIGLADSTGAFRELWLSDAIDVYQHKGDGVQVSGSANGQRYRWNADGTQALEAPSDVDDGKSRPFRITARCS